MPFSEMHTQAPDVLSIRWRLNVSPGRGLDHLTDPRHLGEWLGEPLKFEREIGGEVRVDHGDGYVCRSVIHAADGSGFACSWKFPDEHETRIEVRFVAEGGDRSILELRHVGLAELRASYVPGWMTHLTFFEASVEGAPIPPGQFWNLHGSFAGLAEPM